MTDLKRKGFALWIVLVFLAAYVLFCIAITAVHPQTVKPALPAQHHLAPHTAPPVRPATACRVKTPTGYVSPWESCKDAYRELHNRGKKAEIAWVESKTGK